MRWIVDRKKGLWKIWISLTMTCVLNFLIIFYCVLLNSKSTDRIFRVEEVNSAL